MLFSTKPNFVFFCFLPRQTSLNGVHHSLLQWFHFPAFVDPFTPLYPTSSWNVDPPSGDSHREENKRATSFVILRQRFYWRCGLNRYFRGRLLLQGYKSCVFLQYLVLLPHVYWYQSFFSSMIISKLSNDIIVM